MHKAPDSIVVTAESRCGDTSLCNSSTWVGEGSEIQVHHWLLSKFEASLGYMRSCLKMREKNPWWESLGPKLGSVGLISKPELPSSCSQTLLIILLVFFPHTSHPLSSPAPRHLLRRWSCCTGKGLNEPGELGENFQHDLKM